MKDAAAELAVTPGAISQQVRALEMRLGVALLERVHRGVRLTPEGARLFAELGPAFQSIEEALRPYEAGTGRAARLTISTTPSFAATWLARRLADFAARHPDIEVRLLTSAALADLGRGEADVAIRHGRGDYPGLATLRLFAPKLIVVASPELLRGRQPIRSIDDCLGFPLLQDRGRRDWELLAAAAGGRPDSGWRRGSSLSDDALLIRVAISGQGLAVVRDLYAEDDLAAGRLVRPIADSLATAEQYFLVERPESADLRKNRLFRTWLLAAAAESLAAAS